MPISAPTTAVAKVGTIVATVAAAAGAGAVAIVGFNDGYFSALLFVLFCFFFLAFHHRLCLLVIASKVIKFCMVSHKDGPSANFIPWTRNSCNLNVNM